MKNRLFIFLHSHLPFSLNKGRWPFGEEWLYEISLSTYLPLIKIFDELKNEGIKFKINLGITPVLMDQLKSSYFKEKFLDYIEIKEKNGKKDYEKYKSIEKIKVLIEHYLFELNELKKLFISFNKDIVQAFNLLQNQGFIEIATSCITHSYLPLLKYDYSRELQIKNGVYLYEKYIGKKPKLFWLPECGYKPKVEDLLKKFDLKYFILNYHSLIKKNGDIFLYGRRLIKEEKDDKFNSLFLYQLDNGLYVLLRNPETSEKVWSRDYGYPGDGDYREFHKKSEGSGFQYWRITDKNLPLADKDYYDIDKAKNKAKIHAFDFRKNLEKIFKEFNQKYSLNGIIVAAYDTELFGHWWYEGIEFLKELIRLSFYSDIYKTENIENLEKEIPTKSGEFIESSWGLGGFHYTWYNSETMWMWDKIHEVEDLFYKLDKNLDEEKIQALLKEKFLLESSDFPFLVTTSTAKDYAINRFKEHYEKFFKILNNEITPSKINSDDFVFNELMLRR